jgi:hypothetical protein
MVVHTLKTSPELFVAKETSFSDGFSTRAPEISLIADDHQPQSIRKVDEELRIIWAEVYVPGFPDTQGEFMSADSIREMAYTFLKSNLCHSIDVEHDQDTSRGCSVVESFIARKGDPDFIEDAWVAAVHIPDDHLWKMVKAGEINGFSFMGQGTPVDTILELDIPEILEGRTDFADGHDHEYAVKFAPDGSFLGGVTGPGPDGHEHGIVTATITQRADGHVHRYSLLDSVMEAE